MRYFFRFSFCLSQRTDYAVSSYYPLLLIQRAEWHSVVKLTQSVMSDPQADYSIANLSVFLSSSIIIILLGEIKRRAEPDRKSRSTLSEIEINYRRTDGSAHKAKSSNELNCEIGWALRTRKGGPRDNSPATFTTFSAPRHYLLALSAFTLCLRFEILPFFHYDGEKVIDGSCFLFRVGSINYVATWISRLANNYSRSSSIQSHAIDFARVQVRRTSTVLCWQTSLQLVHYLLLCFSCFLYFCGAATWSEVLHRQCNHRFRGFIEHANRSSISSRLLECASLFSPEKWTRRGNKTFEFPLRNFHFP